MAYQYVWKYGLMPRRLRTVDGKEVRIIHPGLHNRDAGPDFSGARIEIDGTRWAGNIEVHVMASDWFRHGHDTDPAYSNVILHLVGHSDTTVPGANGDNIPQVEAPLSEGFMVLYNRLADKISEVECEPWVSELPSLTIASWLDTLAIERMQRKARGILDILEQTGGDWQRTCFILLARSLGFSLNSDPMEMTARSLTLNILAHHSDDSLQLEALILGQAGLLDTSQHILDEYYQALCREYYFLARKYGLRPLRSDIWKMARTRPQNFPVRRLALLANACRGGFHLLSEILETPCDPPSYLKLLDWEVSGYWLRNLNFGHPGTRLPASLSTAQKELLLINFIAPLLYAYGARSGNPEAAERGLTLWQQLRPENNTYIRQWHRAGIPAQNAMESQALLQLRREYCDRNRCLDCRFSCALLRQQLQPERVSDC
ncbi:MAG: DUF2851 family protein [Muribaculaceae bacterium]|nr:DUF2851 family protein [Muribaculaceae bacterium]